MFLYKLIMNLLVKFILILFEAAHFIFFTEHRLQALSNVQFYEKWVLQNNPLGRIFR